VHQEHSTPGKVGEFLVHRGYGLDRRCPNMGDPLPSDLSAYEGIIVFGGPMSANDDHLDGIRAELNWLEKVVLPSKCPLLGICLGAQEIARVLGGRVGPLEDGRVEIGYCKVRPTTMAKGFLDETTTFYQWHGETFDIPRGAVHLAASDAFEGQAFRYGERVFAIEFHPEMTLEMINRWCISERGAPKLDLSGAQPHDVQVDLYHRHAEDSDRWLNRFLDNHLLCQLNPPLRAAG